MPGSRAPLFLVVLAVAMVRLTAQSQGQPPLPQQRIPVFRSGIDVVPIIVTVTGQEGMPVTGLTQKDFRILEDDKAREIVGFYPRRWLPAARRRQWWTSDAAATISSSPPPAGRSCSSWAAAGSRNRRKRLTASSRLCANGCDGLLR
jgi:hypothetical protein